MMLRVSTTDIEQYRRFVVYDYVQENAMLAKIKGVPIKATWQMESGRSFHSALEKYDDIVSAQTHAELLNCNHATVPLFKPEGLVNHENYIQHKSYVFNKHHLAQAREKIGHCLWEVKGNRIFDTTYGPVNVIAKADNVWGLRVQDTKVKFAKPDGKDWEHDLQWRFYLLVHGAEVFRYNAFTFHEPEEMEDTPGVKMMNMIDFIAFNFWRYDNMEADCLGWLEDYLTWADANKLLPFLHKEPKDYHYG